MRKPVVAGNWKMNGCQRSIKSLVEFITGGISVGSSVDVVVCPPSIYIPLVSEMLQGSDVGIGAQNMSEHCDGAYTGELSSEMLSDYRCQYVILGHSERRALFSETDEQVAKKVKAALAAKLTPIVCIGESQSERESGSTIDVVSRQLKAVIDFVGIEGVDQSIVAYEPVWAIGTGLTASPEQAQAVHLAIRGQVRECDSAVADGLRILYGGSVKAVNAKELFGQSDIDGGLIGGAALKAEEFLGICAAAI